ncbi:MAG: hypothetical protein DCC49_06790 [Acidobacteria bacterium]|nr:MAG: hypothetical protein DCC49_06790 [Acidobacteriota bacterium]
MINGWTVVRFTHVISATIWVGGLLVFTLVVEPKIHSEPDIGEEAAKNLIARVGKTVGILLMAVLLPVLIGTGVALMARRGIGATELLSRPYGKTLFIKLGLVATVVAVAGAHGIASSSGRKKLSRWLSMGTLVISVLIVLFAAALVPS